MDKFDTETDYLPSGDLRCGLRYYDIDETFQKIISEEPEVYGGHVMLARCTRPATVRMMVTQYGKTFASQACDDCYKHSMETMGNPGYPDKVELITDKPKP